MNYIRHDNAVRALYGNLDRLVSGTTLADKTVIVFGTSNLAGMIIHYLGLHGIRTAAIVDNDSARDGQMVYGVRVYPPAQYLQPYDSRKVVLIASTYQEEMLFQLAQMGYQREQQAILVIDLPAVMQDYSFVDRTGYIALTEQEIRESQLRILNRLDTVCRELGLRYNICGGTLIGAVRHQGYIPWDDDIDVVMPMQDIIRLTEALQQEREYSMISFASGVDYFDVCSLMVDNSTVCDFNGFMQLTSGVSIDVFPFTGVPEGAAQQRAYLEQMRSLDMDKWNKLYEPEACREAFDRQIGYMLSFDYDRSETIGNVLSRYFVRDIFPRRWFDETVRLPFETLKLNAPKHYHEYLTKLYGDYRALPPVQKRVSVHYYRAYRKREE